MKKQHTPVFVYGTLREGQRNFRLLNGKVYEVIPATLAGHIMFPLYNGSFPGVVPGEGTVKGELMYINEVEYDETVRRLDGLEGYRPDNHERSMYLRQEVTVLDENGLEVKAYTYIWNERVPQERIESGDFVQWVDEIHGKALKVGV